MAEERAGKRINTHDGSSSSSTPPGSEYQVFLSFRGVDTRKTFTDHLYCHLTAAGIRTFRDKEELRVGKEIRPDLIRAIEESTISIPIFSKGYASSEWCLMELTQMVKFMNSNNGHEIWPIFYDVTPSDVKHQTGSYHEAFLRHTEFNEPVVQEWKEALNRVAYLKGWEKDTIEDGYEGKLVDKIVTEVCMKLKKGNVDLTGDLVGMDHHIKEMTKLLDTKSGNGARIVGIIGMGGIGKTTIAKCMYNKLCDNFQHRCSFLEDVREKVKRNGYAELRKQLIYDVLKRTVDGNTIERSAFRDKKVLIVLDDVEERSQLTEIIGGREDFGLGSRIIVTTRNHDVFLEEEGVPSYEPGGMGLGDSLQLFSKHSFKSTQPSEGYEDISRQLAQSAAGLPLSLVVIGSMLYKKKKTIWEETLKKLKVIPPDKVFERLKISYDALDYGQKQIFLDIACHFIGEDKRLPFYMWEDCRFFPESGIHVLVSLSLVTLKDESVFRMHDQLRDLGRYIVYQENPRIALERSRLWSPEEAFDTLKDQSGTKKVQTLHIKYDEDFGGRSYCFSNHDFKGMSELRYFHLDHSSNLEGDFNRLLPQLRWFRCVLTGIAVTNFCPRNLVILNLSGSTISDDWEFLWKQTEPLINLKVLDLSDCSGLTKTPDLTKFCNLERLILQGCAELTEIGSSVKHLKRLTYLNAKECPRLRKLPPEFGSVTALQEVFLDFSNFSVGQGISELPESIGLLTQLRCLSLRNCKLLVNIPESFGNLKSLVVLDCSRCSSLKGAVPSGIGRLTSLRVLDLSGTEVDTLPEDIRSLCNLRKLNLSRTLIKKLPGIGIEMLQKLELLDCSACSSLKGPLPEGIGSLSSLRVLDFLYCNYITGGLAKDISGMSRLETLYLGFCYNLRLPIEGLKLPLSLTRLAIPFTKATLESLRSLVNLRELQFHKSGEHCCDPHSNNNNNNGTPLLPKLDMPSNLEFLKISGVDDHMMSCRLLPAMKFDSSSRLDRLVIEYFGGVLLSGSLDLSNCQILETLEINFCTELREIADSVKLGSSWVSIDIWSCHSLEVLPNLSTMRRLQKLRIFGCPKLREIKGLEVLTSLEELSIKGCPLLKKDELHPDLLNYESLRINYRDEEAENFDEALSPSSEIYYGSDVSE